MSYRRQISFSIPLSLEHGGDVSKGKRKTKRPFSSNKPIHLVLRSSHATGAWSLTRFRGPIQDVLHKHAHKNGVRVYQFSNNSNHLHLLIRAKSRWGFQCFLRSLSGAIARLVTKAEKGKSLLQRFWDRLAYTRSLEWGRAFETASGYVIQNELEAKGLIPYQPRSRPRMC